MDDWIVSCILMYVGFACVVVCCVMVCLRVVQTCVLKCVCVAVSCVVLLCVARRAVCGVVVLRCVRGKNNTSLS